MKKIIKRQDWRPLYFLNIFRLLIASVFVSFFYFDMELSPFGSMDPEMFHIASIGYLIAGIVLAFALYRQWPTFSIQSHIHLVVDIAGILFLTHASGGVPSGVGLLLIIPIAASGVFLFSLISYFYAATASILILFDQFYLLIVYHLPPAYPQAGILGCSLFFTALLTHYLIRKALESEALAKKMEEDLVDMQNIARFVMHRLQSPVLVVDNLSRIRLKNEAASKLCQQLFESDTRYPFNYLSDFSPSLAEAFHRWLKDPSVSSEGFVLEETEQKVLPQFSPLQKKDNSDVIIFLEDISKINSKAQQLKLASLGRLTASIAHEIRNPLAAISHAGQLLSESTQIPEADLRLTQIIDKQSKRVNGIIDTVLNMSRQHQPKTESLELRSWLKTFLDEQIHVSNQQIAIQYEHDCEQAKHCDVNFDPHHLQQILSNLIQNALAHSAQVGSYKESENDSHKPAPVNLLLSRDPQSQLTKLSVINFGNPIKEEDRSHLFEPFFTTKSNGTGLGLYMSKELANANRASLDYVPDDEKTCFQLSFERP